MNILKHIKNNRFASAIWRGSRVGVAAVVLLLLAGQAFAEGPPDQGIERITITQDDFFWVKLIAWCMVAIVLLLGWITLVTTVKDSSKISFKALMDEFTSKNLAGPEMHHEYDGIRELDNPMPSWLKYGFYFTILFGIAYFFHYTLLKTGPSQLEEYEAEVRLAEMMYKDVELPDDAIKIVTDEAALSAAAGKFEELCTPCHMSDMGGDVGPNLVDKYWLHGGSVKDIYSTITNGVPEKGMISWKKQLTSKERLAVASYILSKQGSQPANPKAPQGEIWTGEDGGSDAAPVEGNVEANDEAVDGEEPTDEVVDEAPSDEQGDEESADDSE